MGEPSEPLPDVDPAEDPLDDLVQEAFRARRAVIGSPSSVFESLGGLEAARIRVRLPEPAGPRPAGERTRPSELPLAIDDRGRYEIAGEIGRGGVGVVVRARDTELGREVAMKFLRADRLHDGRALRRFLEEAQIGGQLEHPGIVPVHDVGASSDGGPFFTMKLVEGRTLRDVFGWVRSGEDGWTTTRALGVLQRVCDAVAFAHERGVVHRDLKPGNVLVGVHGEVYVTDWGLARVIGRDDDTAPVPQEEDEADSSLATRAGDVLGTPAYMPPEQAEGRHDELGPEADVYAIGAMLYHLLAGHPPYAPSGTEASSREIWRAVRAGPPEPLSRAAPRAPEELVAVCEKAMARAASERYRDVRELSADLRAFLEQRVVQAYRTGPFAELGKWTLRNRALALSLAASILLVLAGSVTITAVQASNARRERALSGQLARETRAALDAKHAAERDAELARQERATADRVAGFLEELLHAPAPHYSLGSELTVRELLDETVGKIDREFADDPLVRARLMFAMGKAYKDLGLFESATRLLEEAHGLRAGHLGEDHADSLALQEHLALNLVRLGRLGDAEALLEDGLERARRTLGADDPLTLHMQGDLGWVYYEQRRPLEAEAVLRACLDASLRVLGPQHATTLTVMGNLAGVFGVQGRLDEADRLYVEALRTQRALLGDDHPTTLVRMHNLADNLTNQSRFEEAEALHRECLERSRRIHGDEHPFTLVVLCGLGVHYLEVGRYGEAEAALREVLEGQTNSLGETHPSTLVTMGVLSQVLARSGALEESQVLLRSVLDHEREVHGSKHPATLTSMFNLADLLVYRGRLDEAEPLFRECLTGTHELFPPDHPERLYTDFHVARFFVRLGHHQDAEPLVREYLEQTGPDDPMHATAQALLEQILAELEE